MSWNSKYWDAVDNLYWTPKYLGIESINKKYWVKTDDHICIPKDLVPNGCSLYTRRVKISDQIEQLHHSEEVLNHIFDITFAIVPDLLIEDIFLRPLGIHDEGPFESIGREAAVRYNWGLKNVTQHDGFFTSSKSLVGVDIKLGTSSSAEQVVKYAALMAWEELFCGQREQLGLLYIVPKAALASHWKKCGLDGPAVDGRILDRKWPDGFSKEVLKFLKTNQRQVESVLDRMRLAVISWDELQAKVEKIRDSLDPCHRGDQALIRLLNGFLSQLDAHSGTGIPTRPTLTHCFRNISRNESGAQFSEEVRE